MSPQPSGLVNFLQRRSSGRKVKSCSRPPTRSGANCDGMTRLSLSAQRKIARHSYPASSPSGMPSWPVPFGHRLRSMCAMADSIALGRVAGFFESSIITTHPLKMGALQTEINCENKNARRSGHYVKLLLTRGANFGFWMVALLRALRLRHDEGKMNEFIRGNKPLIRASKNLQRGELFHPEVASDGKDDGSCDLANPHWRQNGDAAS